METMRHEDLVDAIQNIFTLTSSKFIFLESREKNYLHV